MLTICWYERLRKMVTGSKQLKCLCERVQGKFCRSGMVQCPTPCPFWSCLVQLSVTGTPEAMPHILSLEPSLAPEWISDWKPHLGVWPDVDRPGEKHCTKMQIITSLLWQLRPCWCWGWQLYLTPFFFFFPPSLFLFFSWFLLLDIWVILCFMGSSLLSQCLAKHWNALFWWNISFKFCKVRSWSSKIHLWEFLV